MVDIAKSSRGMAYNAEWVLKVEENRGEVPRGGSNDGATMNTRPNMLMVIQEENKQPLFVNLDLIRMVDQIRPDHCRLFFSESHTVVFSGPPAGEIMKRLCERAMDIAGRSVSEIMSTYFPKDSPPLRGET